ARTVAESAHSREPRPYRAREGIARDLARRVDAAAAVVAVSDPGPRAIENSEAAWPTLRPWTSSKPKTDRRSASHACGGTTAGRRASSRTRTTTAGPWR